jgi:hypothetical protein
LQGFKPFHSPLVHCPLIARLPSLHCPAGEESGETFSARELIIWRGYTSLAVDAMLQVDLTAALVLYFKGRSRKMHYWFGNSFV